ncbi:hypothetical protein GCM10025776_18220 [Corallincola platygyrae]
MIHGYLDRGRARSPLVRGKGGNLSSKMRYKGYESGELEEEKDTKKPRLGGAFYAKNTAFIYAF